MTTLPRAVTCQLAGGPSDGLLIEVVGTPHGDHYDLPPEVRTLAPGGPHSYDQVPPTAVLPVNVYRYVGRLDRAGRPRYDYSTTLTT